MNRKGNKKSWEELKSFITFEVFMAVAMKNAVFWNIETPFIPHRKHITSPL
jgi:hypothetical protein